MVKIQEGKEGKKLSKFFTLPRREKLFVPSVTRLIGKVYVKYLEGKPRYNNRLVIKDEIVGPYRFDLIWFEK